jgi:hypothetical protein
MTSRGVALLVGLAAMAGCEEPPPAAGARAPLIYGDDQRRDVYEVEGEGLRRLALDSTAALIGNDLLHRQGDGTMTIEAPTLGEAANLCADQPFRLQPTAAACSAVLVDDQLLLTAGHCATEETCRDQVWVFGYALARAGGAPSLREGDLYRCGWVPQRIRGVDATGRRWDHAFVALDRPVALPRRPAPLATAAVSTGSRVTVIGYPEGLPVKVAAGAEVLDGRPGSLDYFTMDSDTFEGSSGSGVFDQDGRLAGVFVRGGFDYENRPEMQCLVARHLGGALDPAGAEQASHVGPPVAALCARFPGLRLCPVPAACAFLALPRSGGSALVLLLALALLGRLARRAVAQGQDPGRELARLDQFQGGDGHTVGEHALAGPHHHGVDQQAELVDQPRGEQ